MSTEDNDNIYVINEKEEINDPDNSPRNYASYDDEEREADEKEEVSEVKFASAIGMLFKIMFNPIEGWKKLRRSKISLEALQSGCFYPLLALLAVSKFAEFFYSVNVSLTQVVSQAVIAFVSFFFGFFCVQMLLGWLLPNDMVEKVEDKFGKEYTVVGLSTLALFAIVTNLFPMIWPILIFLPIWTLYILFKGVRFFKFLINQEMKFYILSCIAIIGVPMLIDWGLNSILPY